MRRRRHVPLFRLRGAQVKLYKNAQTERVMAWRAANPERAKEVSRKSYLKNKAKICARNKARYLANPAPAIARAKRQVQKDPAWVLERTRAWKKRNRPKKSAELKAWRLANPEKGKAAYHRRRARLSGAGAPGVEPAQWAAILEQFGGACAYCLGPCPRPDREHIIAVSIGGADEPSNVVPACRSCNTSKGNRTLIGWVLREGTANP